MTMIEIPLLVVVVVAVVPSAAAAAAAAAEGDGVPGSRVKAVEGPAAFKVKSASREAKLEN